jgi:hypothetical protein
MKASTMKLLHRHRSRYEGLERNREKPDGEQIQKFKGAAPSKKGQKQPEAKSTHYGATTPSMSERHGFRKLKCPGWAIRVLFLTYLQHVHYPALPGAQFGGAFFNRISNAGASLPGMTKSPQTSLPSSSSQPFGFGYALISPGIFWAQQIEH